MVLLLVMLLLVVWLWLINRGYDVAVSGVVGVVISVVAVGDGGDVAVGDGGVA